jgi:hypothetical protein
MTMPPLPLPGGFTEEQMRDYAIAAIEAYKESLKPVAWRYVRSDGGRSLSLFPPSEVSEAAGLTGQPLYLLDGGGDE